MTNITRFLFALITDCLSNFVCVCVHTHVCSTRIQTFEWISVESAWARFTQSCLPQMLSLSDSLKIRNDSSRDSTYTDVPKLAVLCPPNQLFPQTEQRESKRRTRRLEVKVRLLRRPRLRGSYPVRACKSEVKVAHKSREGLSWAMHV